MGEAGMAAASLIGGGASLANGITQYGAYREQGRFGQTMGNINAAQANLQARAALQQGDAEAAASGMRTRAMIGAQRASYAGQGVDVNSGSAASVQADTAAMGALDQLTIKNNAARAAWGFQIQGISDKLQAQMAGLAGKTNANASLMTGGLAFLRGAAQGGYYFGKSLGPAEESGITVLPPSTMAGPDAVAPVVPSFGGGGGGSMNA